MKVKNILLTIVTLAIYVVILIVGDSISLMIAEIFSLRNVFIYCLVYAFSLSTVLIINFNIFFKLIEKFDISDGPVVFVGWQ